MRSVREDIKIDLCRERVEGGVTFREEAAHSFIEPGPLPTEGTTTPNLSAAASEILSQRLLLTPTALPTSGPTKNSSYVHASIPNIYDRCYIRLVITCETTDINSMEIAYLEIL